MRNKYNKKQRDIRDSIGRYCRWWRMNNTMYTIEDVARLSGFTKQAIQQFEYGLSTNMLMLWWYLEGGMELCNLIRAVEEDVYE